METTQGEIGELALQLSLRKADAKDKFEEAKKEFKAKLTGLKQLFNDVTVSEFVPVRLEWRLQDLELQLQSSSVTSRESFEVQYTALMAATIALGKDIARVFQKARLTNHFRHEVEKFLLKMEIIRLRFGIKRFEVKDSFQTNMKGAERIIRQISNTIRNAKSKARSGKREVKKEIAGVYKHLKRAVKNV